MKERTICKGLAVAVIILFLGLAVQPSVAVQPEQVKNESPIDFCVLMVWTISIIGAGVPEPFTRIKCEDLDTGDIRYRFTGLLGFHLFIGLSRGHTYQITATVSGRSKKITPQYFWNYLEVIVYIHNL